MEGHDAAPSRSQKVPEAEPDVTSLPGLASGQAVGLEFVPDGRQAGTVVPENAMVLAESSQGLTGPGEVVQARPVQADDHLV